MGIATLKRSGESEKKSKALALKVTTVYQCTRMCVKGGGETGPAVSTGNLAFNVLIAK